MADAVVPVKFQIVGLQELKVANAELKKMGGTGGSTAKATRSTAKFGHAAQNASFQVQDLIVQIQGGTDPMRALSQQLPQMAVGMGAWGAAVGLAAAALPALIVAMQDTEKAAMDVDDAISGLTVSMNTFDTSNFVEQFNEATEAQRRFITQSLQARLQAAQAAQQALASTLTGAVDMIGGGATAARELGLPVKVFARNIQLLQEFEQSGATNIDLLVQMRDLYLQTAEEQGGLSEKGQAYLDNLFQMEQALNATTAAQEALNQAQQAVATGEDIPVLEALKEVEVVAERVKMTFQEIAQDPNLGFDTGIFAAEELDRWAASMWEVIETGEEGFSLVSEGVRIFDQTFSTMLDGVLQGTTDLSDGVKNMVRVMLVELGKLAAYQWIANAFAGSAIGTAAAGLLPSAKGNVFQGGDVVPFARGGVVNRPTLFPMANGAGLMGEAGPEAIMPLRRDSQGRLGVSGGMNVVINNNAPGVEAIPRETESGLTIDLVMANVAAAIDRGGNAVSGAIERNYALGRGGGVY